MEHCSSSFTHRIITDADTLGVLKGYVNGVNVHHAPLRVQLTIVTYDLYHSIIDKLDAEELSFDAELLIKVKRA